MKVIIVMTSDKSYRNYEWVYPYRENDLLGGEDPYRASKSCEDIVVNSSNESYFQRSGIAISSKSGKCNWWRGLVSFQNRSGPCQRYTERGNSENTKPQLSQTLAACPGTKFRYSDAC